MTEPIKIVTIGDSITQATNGYNSYRRDLWDKLTHGGYNVDFVGSENQTNRGADFPDSDFDPDHEGHWGWRIDELINGRSGQESEGKLSEWLGLKLNDQGEYVQDPDATDEYTPDIALIHAGTNDASQNNTPTSSIDELKQVISILRQDNPNIVIFIAQLIPADPKKRNNDNNLLINPRIDTLNALIPDLVDSENTAHSPVFLVDQNTGFDATKGADTYDGLHPNESGEAKIAQNWFDALKPYLDTNPECFLPGTHILTDRGEVLVEDLAIGDMVQTADGTLQPIKWIGKQTVNPRLVKNPLRSHPILVKAGALGNNLPVRDLYLSPDHALLVDDLLINAGALVNNVSILKTQPQDVFTYYHIELDCHALLVAEGTYAESYLPQREDRHLYDNSDEFEALYPGQNRMILWPLDYPRVSSMVTVPKFVRKRLEKVADELVVSEESENKALQPA